MKIPSLFRTPRHQRFNLEPRYYDPIEEELDARRSQIESELKKSNISEKDLRAEYGHHFDSRITGSFTRNGSRRSAMNIMQLVILTLMISLLVGYWFFGNIAIYIVLIVSSLLLYLKIRRII